MSKQKTSKSKNLQIIQKRLTDYNIHWVVILFKLIPALIAFLWNLSVRTFICPLIMFPYVRRYVQCVVNLFSMKVILICMGFFRFQCQGFRFFARQYIFLNKRGGKITLRSGFIGIGNHHSILDFIYYSYIANPVFVKILIYKKQDKQTTYYCPLSFLQSIKCAISNRGFDPIIINSQKQFKNIKHRKLGMKTLISQCFQQINGPVFIMLPGLNPNQHISLNTQVANDIFNNQIKFQRSLVGFYIRTDPRLKLDSCTYKNQLFLMLDQMVRIGNFSMYIHAIQFRRMRMRYDRVTYSTFIDRYYIDQDLTLKQLDYETYLKQLNQLQQKEQQKEQSEQLKKIK